METLIKKYMKAIRLHAKGGVEQIVYEEAPVPGLSEGDALVRVLASGITTNELNWGPTYVDEKGNSRLPTIPGHELCGIVENVSPGATGVAVGDHVYALTSFFRNGTAAEYVAVEARNLAPKPLTLNAVQAATLPLAALTAWQALFEHGGLLPGQKVLIHGAAGGVGSIAVQIARWRGATVIATTDAESVDLVKSLGAHQVINYKSERFEKVISDVDLVLDSIGGDTQDRSWQVLKRGGTLVSIAGESIKQPPATLGVRGIFFIVKSNRLQLMEIALLIDRGHIRPVVGAVIPLADARKAFEMIFQSGKKGKIVLQVSE
ncbi:MULTISPECIES: NADP-dependent oxidoreductase [Niastella]|uniref:NADP-dependent oxidoreductase n=1 Tax=Niastella soli TaxID=2821487 RepID=A0ABS3Z3T9_9BACT|nr:NADP-dependent oxidoreductase [Niastella soli]MBO9204833.1 NADP-dependent oxidoreductase [Niastella soli]